MPISKPDFNQIFASQAPDIDKPPVFNNYNGGWGDESRPNNGKPTIKGFNYLQQLTDTKLLWMAQNGAFPYDPNIEYATGVVTIKDGVFKQWNGSTWVNFGKDDEALKKAQNLSDLPNKATARDNLSVYSKTEIDEMPKGGLPVGHIYPWGGTRANIPVGSLPVDGDILNRADFPALWAFAQTQNLVTDSVWLADPTKRGCWSTGDGTTTFRMPDWNGAKDDSIKGLVVRGDGGGTLPDGSVIAGTVQSDTIRNIQGELHIDSIDGVVDIVSNGRGVGVFTSVTTTGGKIMSTTSGTVSSRQYYQFNASNVVPTGEENKVKSVVQIYICKVGNAETPVPDPVGYMTKVGGNEVYGTQLFHNDVTIDESLAVGDVTINGALTVDNIIGFESKVKTALNASGDAPVYALRGVSSILASGALSNNKGVVQSCTRSGTGTYLITITNPDDLNISIMISNSTQVITKFYWAVAKISGDWVVNVLLYNGTTLTNADFTIWVHY